MDFSGVLGAQKVGPDDTLQCHCTRCRQCCHTFDEALTLVNMDKQAATIPEAMHELELEILLHITERLFRNGKITVEMRDKAKEVILKL